MGDKPLTLLGDEVNVGDKAPDFEVIGNDMKRVRLADYAGKVLVLASIPSVDTPVCSAETHRFNAEASDLGDDVAILTISMDLPFAQKRWCGAEGIEHVVTLSDHRDASFGQAYGVLIKETRLLARAVFIVDREGVVRYTEIVPVLGEEPNYETVLAAVKELI
jgi:thiol peroxidase